MVRCFHGRKFYELRAKHLENFKHDCFTHLNFSYRPMTTYSFKLSSIRKGHENL